MLSDAPRLIAIDAHNSALRGAVVVEHKAAHGLQHGVRLLKAGLVDEATAVLESAHKAVDSLGTQVMRGTNLFSTITFICAPPLTRGE